jgi:hypothetical protein
MKIISMSVTDENGVEHVWEGEGHVAIPTQQMSREEVLKGNGRLMIQAAVYQDGTI